MKILLAVDRSPHSNAVIEEFAHWEWPLRTAVRVVTVNPRVEPALVSVGSETVFDDMMNQFQAESEQCLHEAADALRQSAAGLYISTAVLEGRPGDAILTEAERWGADLLVVGSRDDGPIRRLLFGSVSQFVARRAPCSVLIARQRLDKSGQENARGPVSASDSRRASGTQSSRRALASRGPLLPQAAGTLRNRPAPREATETVTR